MTETYVPQDNPKKYEGDTVYDRAKKFLEDKSRGGTDTSSGNTTLDTIIKNTTEYRNAKSTAAQKRAAARELARIGLASVEKEISIDEIKSGTYRPGVSPMNYMGGASVRYNKNGERYEGAYKKDNNFKEGRYIGANGYINDGLRFTELGTSNLADGVFTTPNGNMGEGMLHRDTTYLVDGTYTYKSGDIFTGKFDKDTGTPIDGMYTRKDGTIETGKRNKDTTMLVEGKIQRPDGSMAIGTWDKNGNFVTGTYTLANGTNIEYKDGVKVEATAK